MPAVIYVPQGRSAKLTSFSSKLEVSQLYTNGFTTCNIIVGIGKEQILLVHADLRTDVEQIIHELEQAQIETVFIIYREQGKYLLNHLHFNIKIAMTAADINLKEVNEECEGILVFLNAHEDNSLLSQIKLCSATERPENIFHHPQEQYFLTIHKIEQVIGLKARNSAGTLYSKQLCVYDGIAWLPIKSQELSLDLSNKLIREEMDSFEKNDSYITLARKLAKIVDPNNMVGDLEGILLSAILYLESYLNNYDCELIFKRNMMEFLSARDNKPCSEKDKSLKLELLEFFQNKQVFLRVNESISRYKEDAPASAFKEAILKEYAYLSTDYQARNFYNDLKNKYEMKLSEAEEIAQRAIKSYKEGNFAKAASRFLKVIRIVTLVSTKLNVDLGKAYYNCGRSLYQADQFEVAIGFLKISLELKEGYRQDKEKSADIEKTEKAITECSKRLAESMKENHSKFRLVIS